MSTGDRSSREISLLPLSSNGILLAISISSVSTFPLASIVLVPLRTYQRGRASPLVTSSVTLYGRSRPEGTQITRIYLPSISSTEVRGR